MAAFEDEGYFCVDNLPSEMIRALVERLPVMICPRWVATLAQPIGIDDVLDVAVGGQFAGHQGQHVDHVGRPGRRDRQPNVVLLFQRAQDHAGGGVHQAGVDEAVDLPHRIAYQLSRKHACEYSRYRLNMKIQALGPAAKRRYKADVYAALARVPAAISNPHRLELLELLAPRPAVLVVVFVAVLFVAIGLASPSPTPVRLEG